MDIFTHYPHAPEVVLAHALATVGGMTLVSEPADATRKRAIDFLNQADAISDQVLAKFGMTNLVLGCWLRCSYAEHPQKHQVKKLLMRLSQVWQAAYHASLPPSKARPLKHYQGEKPLLVVPLESFSQGHAMYRCYAPIMEELRGAFYLVGVAATNL